MTSSVSSVYVGCEDGSLHAWSIDDLINHRSITPSAPNQAGQAPPPLAATGPIQSITILQPDEVFLLSSYGEDVHIWDSETMEYLCSMGTAGSGPVHRAVACWDPHNAEDLFSVFSAAQDDKVRMYTCDAGEPEPGEEREILPPRARNPLSCIGGNIGRREEEEASGGDAVSGMAERLRHAIEEREDSSDALKIAIRVCID